MLRRIRMIVPTIAIGCLVAAAHAGDNGAAGQDAPAGTPAQPTAQPTAPPSPTQPTGSAPQAAAPTNGSASTAHQGTPALVLDTQDYEGLLGKSVRAQNGDDLGRIIDVIIDREGRPRAAIIDFGGFLGVGSRKIAVDWRVLKFVTEGKAGRITLALNRNQVRVSPEYKSGEPIVVLGAAGPGGPAAEAEPAPAAAAPEKPGAADKAGEKPEKTPDR